MRSIFDRPGAWYPIYCPAVYRWRTGKCSVPDLMQYADIDWSDDLGSRVAGRCDGSKSKDIAGNTTKGERVGLQNR